jgi:hypothetical protein
MKSEETIKQLLADKQVQRITLDNEIQYALGCRDYTNYDKFIKQSLVINIEIELLKYILNT